MKKLVVQKKPVFSYLVNIEFKSNGIFRLNRFSVAYVPEIDEKSEKADYIRCLRLHTKLKKEGDCMYLASIT